MKMSNVKSECPALYSAIVILANDSCGRPNSDYAFPDRCEVMRAEEALKTLHGKSLKDVLPNYDFSEEFYPGVENDPAMDHYVNGLDTVMDAIEAILPNGKWLTEFINRIFQFDLSDAIRYGP